MNFHIKLVEDCGGGFHLFLNGQFEYGAKLYHWKMKAEGHFIADFTLALANSSFNIII